MGFIEFLKNNVATICVLLVLCAVVGVIIFFAVRKKKKSGGGCSCGCGCSGCPMKGECKHSLQ